MSVHFGKFEKIVDAAAPTGLCNPHKRLPKGASLQINKPANGALGCVQPAAQSAAPVGPGPAAA